VSRVVKHLFFLWLVSGIGISIVLQWKWGMPSIRKVTQPLDGESVVRSGEGRMHGWYHVGDSLLVPSAISTLARGSSISR
jgi:hypothetical protein